MKRILALSFVVTIAFSGEATAAPVTVGAIGDHGWTSLDTRSSSGAHLRLPGDAAAINQAIQFGSAPSGGSRGYAANLRTTTNASKASLGVNNLGGFGSGSDLLSSSFFAEYEWLTVGPVGGFTSRTSPLKFGIQSENYAAPATDTARPTNEENWDFILVHDASGYSPGQWETENITSDSGKWFIYRSGYFGGGAIVGVSDTLENLATNPAATGIFGSGSKIVSIEFGLGSGQQNANNYISYLRTNLINEGDEINFATPEPSSLVLMSLAGIGLVGRRLRRGAKVVAS